MAGRYEAVREPRFEIEQGLGGLRIRVPARRNLFALAFLPVWLLGWTFGGIMAFGEFLRTGEPFLAIWLCGWAAGEVGAFLTIAWMVAGAELIEVSGGDLKAGQSLLGFSHEVGGSPTTSSHRCCAGGGACGSPEPFSAALAYP